jgi:hypothetical protein
MTVYHQPPPRKPRPRMRSIMYYGSELPLSYIIPREGRRPLSEEKIKALMASIATIGLLHPIHLRPAPPRGHKLLAGAHRLEACRRLGWEKIPYVMSSVGTLQEELIEIDENLARAELDAAQQALATQRRAELVTELEQIERDLEAEGATVFEDQISSTGGTKIADSPAPKKKRGRPSSPGSARSQAKALGASKTKIARDTKRAKALGKEALKKVAGTSLGTGRALDALAAMPAEERAELVERAAAGEAVSVPAPVVAPLPPAVSMTPDLAARQLSRSLSVWFAENLDLIQAAEVKNTVEWFRQRLAGDQEALGAKLELQRWAAEFAHLACFPQCVPQLVEIHKILDAAIAAEAAAVAA